MPKYERPPSPPRGERIVLLSWQNAPPHARYPHVPTGYRPGCPASQSSLLGSLFSWHNESANAWSHLLGVVYAATRMHAVATSSASMEARLSVCIFLASAVFCFSASTLAHSLAPVLPREQAARLWSYDLLGICVLIGGSYVPGLRWSFRCRPAHQLAYTAIVAAALLCGAVLSRAPPDDTRFGYRANKGFVTTVIFTAGFGLVCVAHWCTFAPASERVLLLPPVLKMFSWCESRGPLVVTLWSLCPPAAHFPPTLRLSGERVRFRAAGADTLDPPPPLPQVRARRGLLEIRLSGASLLRRHAPAAEPPDLALRSLRCGRLLGRLLRRADGAAVGRSRLHGLSAAGSEAGRWRFSRVLGICIGSARLGAGSY